MLEVYAFDTINITISNTRLSWDQRCKTKPRMLCCVVLGQKKRLVIHGRWSVLFKFVTRTLGIQFSFYSYAGFIKNINIV